MASAPARGAKKVGDHEARWRAAACAIASTAGRSSGRAGRSSTGPRLRKGAGAGFAGSGGSVHRPAGLGDLAVG